MSKRQKLPVCQLQKTVREVLKLVTEPFSCIRLFIKLSTFLQAFFSICSSSVHESSGLVDNARMPWIFFETFRWEMWNWDLIALCAYRSDTTFIKFLKGKYFRKTLWNAEDCAGLRSFSGYQVGKIFSANDFQPVSTQLTHPGAWISFEWMLWARILKRNLDKQIFSSKSFKKYFNTFSSGLLSSSSNSSERKNCWMNFGDSLWTISRYCQRFYERLQIDWRYECECAMNANGSLETSSKFSKPSSRSSSSKETRRTIEKFCLYDWGWSVIMLVKIHPQEYFWNKFK